MINIARRDRRTHTVAALVFASLISAAPVKADTPQSLTDLGGVAVIVSDDALAPAIPQAEPGIVDYEHVGDGEASYYGRELAGNRTASGERFNPSDLTCAHRTLPLGSRLRVTNKANGKSVIVRVNDRGPFTHRRIVDVSLGAAQRIQMVGAGKAMVSLELLR
jgi:rare lipoprotein A